MYITLQLCENDLCIFVINVCVENKFINNINNNMYINMKFKSSQDINSCTIDKQNQ